jgi:CheY-like chemotaxis protein
VSLAHDGRQGIERARQVDPDVMVLDLGLPVVDGVEVCRAVRTFSDCYIVMLTARNEEIDKLIGLSVGADDYVTKPFSPRELLARIHAMLRRPRAATGGGQPSQEAPTRVFGALSVDVAGREVHLDGAEVALTRTDFDVFEALSGRPAVVFSRHTSPGGPGRATAGGPDAGPADGHPDRGVERLLGRLVELAVWINGHVGATLWGRAPQPCRTSFAPASEAGAGNQTWSPDRRRRWVCATP